MPRKPNPEDYTVDLIDEMEKFVQDFREEVKYQETKRNKSSERRMRKLLKSFQARVVKPYRAASLGNKGTDLKSILEGELEEE